MASLKSDDPRPRLDHLERSNRHLRLAITTLLLTLIVVLAGALAFGLAMRSIVAAERIKAQQARDEAARAREQARAVVRQMVDQLSVVQAEPKQP
jgi:hypothetical protein